MSAAIASESVSPERNRRWNDRTIELSLSRSLFRQSTSIKYGSSVKDSIEAAAASWSRVAQIGFRFLDSDLENVSESRSGGDGKSLVTVAATPENVALFPGENSAPPAFTRLFFNRQGLITEADVVLNPYLQFSTDATPGTFDLQSVLTHELGHVLGLGHSPSMSATMYGRMSHNREDESHAFPARSLSGSDVSMVRSVYGPASVDANCCASVAGMATGRSLIVWAEEESTGRVAAAESFSSSGRYSLGGFLAGKYRILAQLTESGTAAEVSVREFDLPTRLKNIALNPDSEVQIKYLGVNGELGSMPIHLSRGTIYQIVIGGVGLDPKIVTFGFSTSSISIAGGSALPFDYGRGLSAVAMTIHVDEGAAEGDYSIFVETANGSRHYMVGAVSVN